MRVYGFDEQFLMSEGATRNGRMASVVYQALSDLEPIEVTQARKEEDKSGVDYWVLLGSGKRLGVDVKVRDEDYAKRGSDDIALETWSVVNVKIGWTLDGAKMTDYILWYWSETGRWALFPFPLLRAVFRLKKDEWMKRYKVSRQSTPGIRGGRGWHSECVFVPRREAWKEIYAMFGGNKKLDEPVKLDAALGPKPSTNGSGGCQLALFGDGQ